MKFSSHMLVGIVAPLLLSINASPEIISGEWYSCVCKSATDSHCEVVKGKDIHGALAVGIYRDTGNETGWGELWIETSTTDDDSFFAAGFLEGVLTKQRIVQHYKSWYSTTFTDSKPLQNETINFIMDQYEFTNELVRKNVGNDDDGYYKRLGGLMRQMHGILDGINIEHVHMTLLDILLLQAAGDLYDIIPATKPSEYKLDVNKLNASEFRKEWHRVVSCSALIKMSDDRNDIFAGHTTWSTYENMLRIFKNYNLGGSTVSFSAKPGLLYSKDDFYVVTSMKQRLVVIETTNGIMDKEMYKLITPQSLQTWQRIPVANTLAVSGKTWTTTFARYNSGTYANQWMVLDLKKFVPGTGCSAKDCLWVIEVAPGIAEAADVTPVFKAQGNHWPSMNVPYFEKVYNASGFRAAYEKYGDQYSYTQCPRCKIFRRDQSSVQNETSIRKILRYNDYEHDPLSKGNPGNAISSRNDLAKNPTAFGGIDTKVTSFSRMASNGLLGIVAAQNGPTHDQLPAFSWSGSGLAKDHLHLGQPDTFDFGFVDMFVQPQKPRWYPIAEPA